MIHSFNLLKFLASDKQYVTIQNKRNDFNNIFFLYFFKPKAANKLKYHDII